MGSRAVSGSGVVRGLSAAGLGRRKAQQWGTWGQWAEEAPEVTWAEVGGRT